MNKASKENTSISACLQIARRYVRSVNIERDMFDPHALEGYVITPTVRYTMEHLLEGLRADSTQRAWRITGPYGAGKSAFGLFLTKLLDRSNDGWSKECDNLAKRFPDMIAAFNEVPRYMALPITGRRVSFADALSESMLHMLENNSATGRKPHILNEVIQFRNKTLNGEGEDGHVFRLLLDFSYYVQRSNLPYDGVLLLIDEMGKFLEYVALNPNKADTLTFQQLAEHASGSTGVPLAVVAFLHQRFADYALEYGPRIQEEWAKVSERFEDIPFQESFKQYIFLLGDAIQYKKNAPRSSSVAKQAKQLYRHAVVNLGMISVKRLPDLMKIAPNLFPIHPTVLSALSSAIQRFGQNERSLFSFLLSHEPYGFQQFVESQPFQPGSWYRLADLYNYLAANGSLRIQDGDRRRRWDLLQDNLRIGQTLSDKECLVLKTVGLINVLEPLPGLTADRETIIFALSDTMGDMNIGDILDNLVTKGHLFRRNRRNDYCLWSHTSVDLQVFYEQAQQRVLPLTRLDNVLRDLPPTRPLVAHRHYFKTGTLRAFRVRILPSISLEIPKLATELGNYDGEILVVPVYPDQDFSTVRENIRTSEMAQEGNRLFYLRQITQEDLAIARELSLWQWILSTCEELRADDFARREVNRRLSEMSRKLMHLLEDFRLLEISDGEGKSKWIHRSEIIEIQSRLDLSQRQSTICEHIYHSAPVIKNELINRTQVSAAVAGARNNLISQIFEHEGEEYLGFTGSPPEKTIYLSIFYASGLHRNESGQWGFYPPPQGDPCNWQPVWNDLRTFIKQSGNVSLRDVLKFLSDPPYGLRQGVAILLVAAFLMHYHHDLVLFEKGTYQVQVTKHHFMRMPKNISNFSIRYIPKRTGEADLLETFLNDLDILKGTLQSGAELPDITGEIYKWFSQLPFYVLNTRRISSTAKSIRNALKKAVDPVDLLYDSLPMACGLKHSFNSGPVNMEQAEVFLKRINSAFNELNAALSKLRAQLNAILLETFGIGGSLSELRGSVRDNYLPFVEKLADYQLKSFLIRAGNAGLSDEKWLESIASLFTGKSLASWQDDTIEAFTAESKGIAGRLKRWAALLLNQDGDGNRPEDLIGVHIVSAKGIEHAFTVQRNGNLPPKLESLRNRVRVLLLDEPNAPMVLAQVMTELLEWNELDETIEKGQDGTKH